MDEYRVKLTVRNNLLLSAIEDAGFVGWGQQASFARSAGISVTALNELVAMRSLPITETGEFSTAAKAIMEALGAAPSDLWTAKQLNTRLRRNTGEFYVDESALQAMIESHDEAMSLPDPADLCDKSMLADAVKNVLSTLSDRERTVLAYRSNDETLESTGKAFNVTRERIREIEAKALRKLRHPSKSRLLHEAIGQDLTEAERKYTP